MRLLLLFLLLPVFIVSCYKPSSIESMVNLRVIVGEWQSYKGVKFNENWRIVNENIFEGEGFSLNDADTSFFEFLMIERVGDSIYYKVGLDDEGSSIDFLLTEASDDRWTFINPDNIFPSKIIYKLDKDSSLTVTISNIRDNKQQFFYLKKIW